MQNKKNTVEFHPLAAKELDAMISSHSPAALKAAGYILVICEELVENGLTLRPMQERRGVLVDGGPIIRVYRTGGYELFYAHLREDFFGIVLCGKSGTTHKRAQDILIATERREYWFS